MESNNSGFGQHIRNLRMERQETLHQVSKGSDIDSPLLSKLERGERLPTQQQIKKIAKYYNIAESNLNIMVTAERIIKKYGVNKTTYEAIRLVEEIISPYFNKRKNK